MPEVAVVAYSSWNGVERERNEVEILMPVVRDVFDKSGLTKEDIGFTCSGTSDFLAGQPFSFVSALDAVGAWPPITESHVEMDGAWALYEAWVRLQHGDLDTALVYAVGKSSMGDLLDVLCLQLDPYVMAPLWPDPISLAALQARAYLERRGKTENDLAAVAARGKNVDMDAPYIVSPLRRYDCPPVTDGAAAVILAVGDRARELCERPAWITGIDHRIEQHALGARDLTASPSTKLAGEKAGASDVEIAELHAPFTHQELILRDALGINGATINPSGGALTANPVMVAGLQRIGEAAQQIIDGSARKTLGHATSGPCLQQNLVCVMEAR
jgi:acetyl-CoA acetyltransferase